MTTTPGKSNQTYLKFSVRGDTSQGSKLKGRKQTKRIWTRQIVGPLVDAHCLRAAIPTCRDLSLPLIHRRERSTRPSHWRAEGIRQASFIADDCVRLNSGDWNSSFGFGKFRRNDCPPAPARFSIGSSKVISSLEFILQLQSETGGQRNLRSKGPKKTKGVPPTLPMRVISLFPMSNQPEASQSNRPPLCCFDGLRQTDRCSRSWSPSWPQ
jgi:hypothetical protein